jgi:alcohol dehydrogenase class IV
MMMCSLEGGLSFQKGLGAVHSLSHPLGALTSKKLHHGTLNAIFLPHVLRYNAACCFDKFKLIAERLNIENASSLPGVFDQLNNDLGLATRLRDLGVTKSDLEPLAEIAFNDHCTPTNPCVMQVSDFALLYDIAW